MKRRLLLPVLAILVVIATLGLLLSQRPRGRLAQALAIPSYFTPGPFWATLGEASPRVGVAIINPSSGPGTALDVDYLTTVQQSQARAIRILGYVATDHGNRDAGEIRREIDAYYAWYQVDGIFFDQATTDCGFMSYYADLHSYVKAKANKALIVLNPGIMTNECFMTAADIVITFENTYQTYVTEYHEATWVRKYRADRIWHLVYDAPTPTEMQNAVRLSKQRRTGWIYVTSGTMPNPWNALPSYWNEELSAVQ